MRIAVSRAPDAERNVSPLELLFDLVYVFAIGQLSEHLLAHVDLRTGVETVILALAVFYAWYMTAPSADRPCSYSPSSCSTTRRSDVPHGHARWDSPRSPCSRSPPCSSR
jgi:hypothetical protein